MKSEKLSAFRLAPWFSERPWGRIDLRPWYTKTGKQEPVGEAWLTGPQSVVETGPFMGQTFQAARVQNSNTLSGESGCDFPLLVKLLFPNDKLSVQVHPDDTHAREMGQARGKTECWYVLQAEPGAAIALGLRPGSNEEEVREAIAAGTLEDLLRWIPVSAGDMVFVDAGTIHAIGPGMVLLETQQTCDVTFRMYDYGRPRELHVEQALKVMRTQTAAGKVVPVQMERFTRLIKQKYFVVDRYEVPVSGKVDLEIQNVGCLVGLDGSATIEGQGSEPIEMLRGHAVITPANCGNLIVRSDSGSHFVHCWTPT